MNTEVIKSIIEEENSNAIMLKGFEEALIGTGKICNKKPIAAYDTNKIIEILMNKNNIGDLEAYEVFQSTIKDAFPDINDPVFINDFRNIVDPQDVLELSEIFTNDTIDKLNINHK